MREARACAKHWREQGVDLSGYNTEQNADDVDAVRAAIGADKVNLVGFSYGTHLTLATIRRHEGRVARAVIVGPASPENLRKIGTKRKTAIRKVVNDRVRSILPAISGLAEGGASGALVLLLLFRSAMLSR